MSIIKTHNSFILNWEGMGEYGQQFSITTLKGETLHTGSQGYIRNLWNKLTGDTMNVHGKKRKQ